MIPANNGEDRLVAPIRNSLYAAVPSGNVWVWPTSIPVLGSPTAATSGTARPLPVPKKVRDRVRNHALLVEGLAEETTGTASAAVDERPGWCGTPVAVLHHGACGAPAGLEQIVVGGTDGQAGAADGAHPRAGGRPVGAADADIGDLVALTNHRSRPRCPRP